MISVVLPVRDGGDLLRDAVDGLATEVAPLGGEVVVVDDASTDHTASVARSAGAVVVGLDEPAGPYVARNAGWAVARHSVCAFVDVRCRPRAGWAQALLDPFTDDSVAVVGGDVMVAEGATVAARAAHVLQPLRLADGATATFLPFAPTCNLAVRRSVLASVDGFAEVRGGGDVDLCWRIQHGGLGRFEAAPDAVLDWVPRPTVRDLLGQFRRYGDNEGRLGLAWSLHGCPRPATHSPARVAVHSFRTNPGLALPIRACVAAARAAYATGVRRGSEIVDPSLGPSAGRVA